MNPRDAYIAYQSEIGTEEVVLTRPWARKAAIPAPTESDTRKKSTLTEIPNGPDFFQAVARALKEPAVGVRHAVPPLPAQPQTMVPFPEFKDLDSYWKFLAADYPKWFPNCGPLARAEGMVHSALTVVELSPQPAATPKVFARESGELFDKMMKAIHLDRGRLYLTSLMKSPPIGKSWPRKDLARMLPMLFRELKLAACPMVLLLGEDCAQAVLRTGASLDAMRGMPIEADGLVFAASYHPAVMEGNEGLKRKAWDDLKWLRLRLGPEGA